MRSSINRRWFGCLVGAIVAVSAAPVVAEAAPIAPVADTVREMAEMSMTIESGSDSRFEFSVPAGRYLDGAGTERTFAAKAIWVCIGRSNSPHYSAGSKGVIAKAQVNCSGETATLPIKVLQYLGRTTSNSIASLVVVKQSNYVQNVVVNSGWSNPWYVPALGENGAARGAYFRASHAGGTVPPLIAATLSGGNSAFIYVA